MTRMPALASCLGDRDDAVVEELRLVDADDLRRRQADLLDERERAPPSRRRPWPRP